MYSSNFLDTEIIQVHIENGLSKRKEELIKVLMQITLELD